MTTFAAVVVIGLHVPAQAAHSGSAAAAPDSLSGEALAELRAALDTEPTPPPLSGKAAADLAAKDRAARASWNEMQQKRDGGTMGTLCIPELCGVPANGSVSNVLQYPQERGYWCGPSALRTALRVRIASPATQTTLASKLGTTTDGTAWYDGTYPMENALDSYLGAYGANYASVALSGSPSTTDKSNYKIRIYNNTKNNWATVGDAYEVTGGPHLVGHPNSNIFHWFTIYGYSNYGDGTNYADPASGSSSVSWGSQVPKYSNMSSDTIVVIMGGRGYVW
ncbi:cysteine peptidase family C39 domain-containing protein [Micromonospora narathiwatensis]|uniref:C39 family peptidase n=1 Tax=Micromonospora narathiwatensis TaxID=299146 RepID=UPI0012FE3ECC|nr:C39 family peptidase [Micromonospora narathiwatensis]